MIRSRRMRWPVHVAWKGYRGIQSLGGKTGEKKEKKCKMET
jgi:hypothetical protein